MTDVIDERMPPVTGTWDIRQARSYPQTIPGDAHRTHPVTQTAYPIESVERVLSLLTMFVQEPEIRLCDARSALGVGQSTAHRLLTMLSRHGFVVQDSETRAYRSGPAMEAVGLKAVGEPDRAARAVSPPGARRVTTEWSSPIITTTSSGSHALKSVNNALHLIFLLGTSHSIRLTDTADELGVARSTAHRLLTTMVSRGYAIQGDDRQYFPGPAFIASGQFAARQPGRLRSIAYSHLGTLAEITRETVRLVGREGTDAMIIDCIAGSLDLSVQTAKGATMAAYLTSGGKAMLADLSRAEIEHLYRDDPLTPSVLNSLESVRQLGYATNVGGSIRGSASVSVCVRDSTGRAQGAISVAFPTLRLTQSRIPSIAAAIKAVVRDVESELS